MFIYKDAFSVCFSLLNPAVSMDSISDMFQSLETEADIDSITCAA